MYTENWRIVNDCMLRRMSHNQKRAQRIFVIASSGATKDLVSQAEQQILRFAQDDKAYA